MIDMLLPGEHGLPSGEELALREHLAVCPHCHTVAEDVGGWDAKLQVAMTSVTPPIGLRDRLFSQLSQSAPQVTTNVPSVPTRARSLRRMTSWLVLPLLLVAGVVLWINRPPQLQMTVLESGATQQLRNQPDARLSKFDHSFSAEIADSKWQKVCQSMPVGLNVDNRAGHDLAAFRVNIPALRFRGWLILVPITRVVDVPTSTYPDTVHYAQTAAWNDGKFVYICLAEQGSLEALVAQWNSAAA